MAKATVKWYGDSYTRDVREMMKVRLQLAAQKLVKKVVENISTQGPPPSTPGQFPHKDRGTLAGSIVSRENLRDLKIEVFSTDPKAGFVEGGTAHMDPRPFLRRTLVEARPMLRQVMLQRLGSRAGGRFKMV